MEASTARKGGQTSSDVDGRGKVRGMRYGVMALRGTQAWDVYLRLAFGWGESDERGTASATWKVCWEGEVIMR